MERKPSSHKLINERRRYFRVDDTVLIRIHPVDETSALSNTIPQPFIEDPTYSLMNVLQTIDHDSSKYIRSIAELNTELEAYLKGLNKKIDLIAAKIVENEQHAPDQVKLPITLSEGGLSFRFSEELSVDSYLATQLTLLPSQHMLILFCKVISCTKVDNSYTIALSFIQLKDSDRQYIARHLMQLQLAERRQQSDEL